MRLLAVLLAVLILAVPAMAQTQRYSSGGMTCPQRVGCADDGYNTPPDILAATASACTTMLSGYPSPTGFFDTSQGLDGNGCLSAIPNSLPKGAGAQLAPKCCIIKRPEGYCSFHCDLIPQ